MPTYERFKLALTNVDGVQWRSFERLATVFLADEYPSLRPMAAASGDEHPAVAAAVRAAGFVRK